MFCLLQDGNGKYWYEDEKNGRSAVPSVNANRSPQLFPHRYPGFARQLRSLGFLCSRVICVHQTRLRVKSCAAIVYKRASAMLRVDGVSPLCTETCTEITLRCRKNGAGRLRRALCPRDRSPPRSLARRRAGGHG